MAKKASINRNKMTFLLSEEVIREIRDAVREGKARSQNALVEEALIGFLQELRRERLRQEFEEASHDAMFLRDINETMKAFRHADSETAEMIPK